ncbi:MAG: hypothetical protein ACUVSB_13575 [Anaerolineae bacterium]
MDRVFVVLDEQQQTQLRMILVDRDKAEALRFLREVIMPQIESVQRKSLRGHLEADQR